MSKSGENYVINPKVIAWARKQGGKNIEEIIAQIESRTPEGRAWNELYEKQYKKAEEVQIKS